MDESKVRSELQKYFTPALDDNEELMAECLKLCTTFDNTPERLFYQWESIHMNNKTIKPTLTLTAARNDLRALLERQAAERAAKQRRLALANQLNQTPKRKLDGIMNIGQRSGVAVKTEPGRTASPFGTPVKDRAAGPSRVKLTNEPSSAPEAKAGRAYRYMYEKVSERSSMLDDRIDEFAEIYRQEYEEKHNLDLEFADPAARSEEEVYVMGRIALDTESATTGSVKLNEASIVLESSRQMGSGARVPLRFDQSLKIRGGAKGTGAMGLFPGALVALKGRNGSGEWFLVSEILSLPPLKIRGATKHQTPDATVVIASGPYTVDGDLKYEPWKLFLDQLRTIKPDVIILIGPFIDAFHGHIRNGDVTDSPQKMFQDIFVDPISATLDRTPGSFAIMIPSVRDILSDHAVLPQNELSLDFLSDPRIKLFPNPSSFALDGRHFAITSVDTLFHIKKEELLKRVEPDAEVDSTEFPNDAPGTDAFAAVVRHVIRQRSMYPVFPVPVDLAQEVNLDVTHWDGLALTYEEEPGPDVLIIPSRYKQFVKRVDGVLAINPSFLTKSTFVQMKLSGTVEEGIEIIKTGS